MVQEITKGNKTGRRVDIIIVNSVCPQRSGSSVVVNPSPNTHDWFLLLGTNLLPRQCLSISVFCFVSRCISGVARISAEGATERSVYLETRNTDICHVSHLTPMTLEIFPLALLTGRHLAERCLSSSVRDGRVGAKKSAALQIDIKCGRQGEGLWQHVENDRAS
jgi:hypothetical protein